MNDETIMEWIDVESELPRPAEVVLVCAGKGYAIGEYVGRQRPRWAHWCISGKGTYGDWRYAGNPDGNITVTHWMRLPPAPKKQRMEKVLMKHGRWEKSDGAVVIGGEKECAVRCSICKSEAPVELPYCPWCGSMMDEEGDDD